MKISGYVFAVGLAVAGGIARAEILLADPSLTVADGKYYLVGTENGVSARAAVFPLYVSSDLDEWRLAETPNGEGRLLAKADAFGKKGFWAPQLFRRDGRWYFAYTSEGRWGIATAERPEGPFKTFVDFPSEGRLSIDPSILQDDDGRVYAHYSWGGNVFGVELSSDLRRFVGQPVRCVRSDQDWERLPLEKHYADLNAKFGYTEWDAFRAAPGVIEGPAVLKRCGKYVLFYSANDFRSPDYCVGVAVAERPLGPYRKVQGGPVLSRHVTGFGGTGHGDAFVGPDGALWYVFHAHHSGLRISPRRTGVIRLVETVGADGLPRYAADYATLRLF